MGTLSRHGEGPNATYTYSPLGGQWSCDGIDTASLLLLSVQASRLVWHRNRCHPGVQAAWRTVMAVARDRRGLLTREELDVAAHRLPREERRPQVVLTFAARARNVVAHALRLASDYYARQLNAPLGDRLSSSVVSLLGEVAFLLRTDEPRLQRLHELEARCLIHGWTHTRAVIPPEVLRGVLAAANQDAARAVGAAARCAL